MNDELNAKAPLPDSTLADSTPAGSSSHRLVLIALAATLATFAVTTFYPSGRPVDETMELSFGSAHAWIVAQSFLLMLPGLIVGLSVARLLPRLGALLGTVLMYAVPAVVICDVLTFAWIGERFLSRTMQRVCTTLLPAMRHQITRSSVVDAVVAIVVGLVIVAISWWVAGIFGRIWAKSRDSVQPFTTVVVLTVLSLLMSIPAVWNYSATRQAMRDHSTRHPFCAFHLVGYRGVGVAVPKGERAVLARLRGLQAAPAAQEMDERFLNVELDRQRFTETADQRDLQDVIVVVIESLRPEVVNPEVMPNLHEFAKESIYCKQHFSNGNSTSFGMFALMSGVESVWFDRPVSERPIMNRVLYQAGYQLAFYGGSTGWAEFEMDGYVRGEHYDEFKIENADLPATDYKVVERTLNFILEGKRLTKEDPATSSPRVGIAYMLATHCRYISEEQDQIFQPAAPENFLIPYSEAMRDQVYNRYKNSARTVDRMIKPLLRDDCIVIVIGDHGESFLEDGSAIHGLRLSKVQNMTPLILGYPGVKPRIIEQRTMHADILPTLFSILKIPVTDPEIFDGCDLTTVDPQTLSDRIFTTTNFMDRTSGLIGPWTLDPTRPFAYRFLCNIGDWQVDYLNPIDDQGYQRDDSRPGGALSGRQLVRDWMIQKIGPGIVREDRSEAELFSEFLRSEDRETRFSALKIANDIARPEPYLYDLIVKLTRDNDPEIRVMAKEIVIRTERYVGQN